MKVSAELHVNGSDVVYVERDDEVLIRCEAYQWENVLIKCEAYQWEKVK